ncbi:MAG: anti-sigma factor antagonist [Candidatus Omnitrophota bacterium]
MKVNIKSESPVLILCLEGELTVNNRENLHEKLDFFLQDNKNIVIDASRLTYVDSSGLGLFLEINKRLKQNGLKSLVLVNLNPIVRKSLEVTHLVQVMPVYNSETEAVAGFTGSWNWQIPSSLVYVKSVSNKALESLSSLGLDKYFLAEIRLCIEEAVVNAIKHGNKLEREKPVAVSFKLENRHFEFSVTDEGDGFNTENRGNGLSLIFNFMNNVKFNQKGNAIVMAKDV